MYSFRELGHSSLWFLDSIRIFFTFLGHFFSGFFHCMAGRLAIGWSSLVKAVFLSGARLVFPIVIISSLLGVSISLSLFSIFSEIHMDDKALPIAQKVVISNLAPLLVGIILSIQSALNLINANVHKLHHTPDEVMCEYIIPITISIIMSGVLLYIYALFTFLVTIYATFHYILNVDISYNMLQLANSISIYSLLYSVFKVLIFCNIIALVVGYYYYEISIREISLRKAVSRIMTRSLLLVIFFAAYLNIFYV